jgi:hypothetical protein
MTQPDRKAIDEALAERRTGPRRDITSEEAFRLAREEREKRELEGTLVDAAKEGLPPPILEGDAFDVATGFEETEDVAPRAHAEDWMKVPEGLKMPAGWTIFFVRFRAAMTNTPKKGDRVAIVWNLSEVDEKLAARRSQGSAVRIIDEMAKGMIRAIDGKIATPQDVQNFWSEIGGKCRHQLKSLYLKNHTMSPEENTDFLDSCIASRTAG